MLYSSNSRLFLAAIASTPMCCLGLQVKPGSSLLHRSASTHFEHQSMIKAAPDMSMDELYTVFCTKTEPADTEDAGAAPTNGISQSLKSRSSSLSCVEDSLNYFMREKDDASAAKTLDKKKIVDEKAKIPAPEISVAELCASVDTTDQKMKLINTITAAPYILAEELKSVVEDTDQQAMIDALFHIITQRIKCQIAFEETNPGAANANTMFDAQMIYVALRKENLNKYASKAFNLYAPTLRKQDSKPGVKSVSKPVVESGRRSNRLVRSLMFCLIVALICRSFKISRVF